MTTKEMMEFCKLTTDEVLSLMEKKNNDYTAGSSPFANFNSAEDYGVNRVTGLSIRMGDKMKRVQTFCKSGKLSVENEGVEDAYKDLIGYSLLALAMLEDERQSK